MNIQSKLFFLLTVFILGNIITYGQFTKSDSSFLNGICGESPYISYWNYPGNWFHRKEPTSITNFYEQIDSNFIFHNEEFADCYRRIRVNQILERDTIVNQSIDSFEDFYNNKLYGTRSPFVRVGYELNGKSAYSYAALDSTTAIPYNTDVAYVIITGTGTNSVAKVIKGIDYHSINCKIRNFIKPKGDLYVLTEPNNEQRAIVFNKKKVTSTQGYTPPFLINYLNASNKTIGVTRLIESVAMVKYLKTKYKKVYVLGLSTGGKVALWVSLLSNPDAALIASGYSILVDNDYNSQLINNMMYGTYLQVFNKDSTKNRVKQLSTQILFTQAQNDSPLTQLDIDSQLTQNFYQNVENTSFFYNYTSHAFPPCPNIDSFLTRCDRMAKVFLSVDTNLCNQDSLILHLNFYGKPPFTFQVYNQNQLVNTFACNSLDTAISLYSEGKYTVNNIFDSVGVKGYLSDTIFYIKKVAPSFTITSQEWLCDSLKTKMIFETQGIPPFTFFWKQNNQNDSIVYHTSKDSLLLMNGNYHFLKLQDASNCYVEMNQNDTFNFASISAALTTPVYHCDSNKTQIHFDLQGNAPWTIFYKKDGINQQVSTNQASLDLLFENGNYLFTQVKDITYCTFNLNQSYNFNGNPIDVTISAPIYHCDSNKTAIQFSFSGNAPWIINYTKDNNPAQIVSNSSQLTAYFDNGNYQFISVSDVTNCTKNINQNFNFIEVAVNGIFNPTIYDCASNKNKIELETQGKFPMILTFYDSSRNALIVDTMKVTPFYLFLDSGSYYFMQIEDANHCVKNLNNSMQFKNQMLSILNDSLYYKCSEEFAVLPISLSGKSPWKLNLNYQGETYQVVKNNFSDTLHLQKGFTKLISLKDGNNCQLFFNNFNILNPFKKILLRAEPLIFNCGDLNTPIAISTSGNYPMQLYGTNTDGSFINKLYNEEDTLLAPVGIFHIDSIVDIQGCKLPIYYSYSIESDTTKFHLKLNKMILESGAISTSGIYTWYLNDEKNEETNESYLSVKQNGTYQMSYLNSNNCLQFTDKLEVEMDDVIVYPNPVDEDLNVFIYIPKNDKVKMQIVNIVGDLVAEFNLHDGKNEIKFPSRLRGFYILKFHTNSRAFKYLDKKIFKK